MFEPDMEVQSCCECGVRFGMLIRMVSERRKDHKNFYCPNGHCLHFPQKSDEEKLRDQVKRKDIDLKREKKENARLSDIIDSSDKTNAYWQTEAEAAQRSAASYKGHCTRLKRELEESK